MAYFAHNLLTILCAALASGHRSVHAIAQWTQEHAAELVEQLQPKRHRLPSAATLYRAVRSINVAVLEDQLAHYAPSLEAGSVRSRSGDKSACTGQLIGQSIDGKEVRGARAHGHPVCLVSLVRHDSGVVLEQRAVDQKSNEIKAVPHLLQGQDLRGTVTTMDALLTQRAIAQQIVGGGGAVGTT